MEAVVWDIKTRLDEIFAFLSEISLRAGRKEDYKTYQSFPRQFKESTYLKNKFNNSSKL